MANTPTPIRKGFRTPPAPTKGEVMEENKTLSQELDLRINGVTNLVENCMTGLRQLGPEVDALTTLEASNIQTAEVTAQKGDHVMLDYVGVLLNEDGTPETDEDDMPKYQHSMYGLKFTLRNLGTGSLISGFEESLEGKKSGDNYEVELTFPAEYQAKELQGRKARFLVYVHRVYRPFPVSSVEATIAEYSKAKNALAAKKAIEKALAAAKAEQTTQPLASVEPGPTSELKSE